MLAILFALVLTSRVCSAQGPGHHGPGHNDQDPVSRTCELIKNYRCNYFHDDPHCGTDQRTYKNMCEFSQAHCDVRNLHVAHKGPCQASTTVGSHTVGPGSNMVYHFFCQNLDHQQCGTDQEILCGSDGVTYTNLCQFEKARCQDPSLTVAGYLACPIHDEEEDN